MANWSWMLSRESRPCQRWDSNRQPCGRLGLVAPERTLMLHAPPSAVRVRSGWQRALPH